MPVSTQSLRVGVHTQADRNHSRLELMTHELFLRGDFDVARGKVPLMKQ